VTIVEVLCGTTVLGEDGETLTVGDVIDRPAIPHKREYYGGELDLVPWLFDNYAFAGPSPGAIRIVGRVTAIEAIYVSLTRATARGGWAPRRGSARRVPVHSTSATERPTMRPGPITWSEPDANGHRYGRSYGDTREGDEDLSGWLVVLEAADARRPGSPAEAALPPATE
jgi:hypothetical protein